MFLGFGGSRFFFLLGRPAEEQDPKGCVLHAFFQRAAPLLFFAALLPSGSSGFYRSSLRLLAERCSLAGKSACCFLPGLESVEARVDASKGNGSQAAPASSETFSTSTSVSSGVFFFAPGGLRPAPAVSRVPAGLPVWRGAVPPSHTPGGRREKGDVQSTSVPRSVCRPGTTAFGVLLTS